MQGTHQNDTRTGKEIMHHIDSEPTSRQVCQQTLDLFGSHIHLFHQWENGDRHHHDVKRTIGKEKFQQFFAVFRQSGYIAETEKSYDIADQKHRDPDQQDFIQTPVVIAQVMS